MQNCTAKLINESGRERWDIDLADSVVRLLIVDRDPAPMLMKPREGFSVTAYRLQTAVTAAAALESVRTDPPEIILLNPQLSDRCGLELHKEIRRIEPRIPVIFITSTRSANVAIKAMKQGAFDCLFKPLEGRQLQRVLDSALKAARELGDDVEHTIAPTESEPEGDLRGSSDVMREVYKSIGLVAAQDVNVLITGESGTGKELVARAIFQNSARSESPFLALNCAAIPENLLESELFGHEKGAFSGADRRRIGKFEQYNGGTILLDEIGDMPLNLQAKILRLLQEQTFERVGGNETIRTDVHLIASTHRDLKALSAEGKFRPDLYYRLCVFNIHLPPLRERVGDLDILAHYFLTRYSREMGRETQKFAPEAMERLRRHHWPGNIRELQSVLRRALLRSTSQVLLASSLPSLSEIPPETSPVQPPTLGNFDINTFLHQRLTPEASDLYADLHREVDRHSLARVMTFAGGNQHMASRVLGIARQTLRTKLRETGLQVSQSSENA